MRYEEPIDLVRQQSGIPCSDDVKTAVLRALGEYPNERERLAEILRRRPTNRGMIFSPNLGCEGALSRASAVTDVSGEAISGTESVRRESAGGFDPFEPGTGRRGPETSSERS